MMQRWTSYALVLIISGAMFVISNEGLKGYLRSEVYLAKEIKSPLDSIDQYRLSEEAPFKYRVAFPSIVKGSYGLLYEPIDVDGFYNTYRIWSLIFYCLSAVSMLWLLMVCGFNHRESFFGAMLFLFLPAMMMAFTLPVHTREDTLAYCLFFVGLGLLLKERRWPFLLLSIMGAFTRETLLLLPALYFLFAKDESPIRRATITVTPILVWLALRLYLGLESYDVWEGLRWNVENLNQVIGFLFVSFNVLWLSLLLEWWSYRRDRSAVKPPLLFFYRSVWITTAAIIATTFAGGIFNEIRLLNLLAPWMIVFFLQYCRNFNAEIRTIAGTKNYWLYAGISFVLCAMVSYMVVEHSEKIIPPGRYAVPYDQWIIFTVIYIFMVLLFLPHAWRTFMQIRSSK
jgi:hypothetical protein